MPLYTYLREEKTIKKRAINYFSYLTLAAGAFLLFWAFYPVISFEIYSKLFIANKIMAPIPQTSSQDNSDEFMGSVLGSSGVFSNNLRDFTQASLWFPAKTQIKSTKVKVGQYFLSIPKLNIELAAVKTQGDDLTKSLIHFLPTSLPGQAGNVAIFGHSTLPQLYNPRDYKTIFTYLPSLNKKDKIVANVDGINYEYEVYEMFVVKPDQISVLEQKYDASYLTLITCVPPGTYWNRLVVRAKLIELPTNL